MIAPALPSKKDLPTRVVSPFRDRDTLRLTFSGGRPPPHQCRRSSPKTAPKTTSTLVSRVPAWAYWTATRLSSRSRPANSLTFSSGSWKESVTTRPSVVVEMFSARSTSGAIGLDDGMS